MRTDLLKLTLLVWAAIGLTPIVQAQPTKPMSAAKLVAVKALADTRLIAPGQEFQLAFVFDIEPQWHIYWVSPGATGMPTQVEVSAPKGFEVGATIYPRPQAIGAWDSPEGMTYGYETQVVLFVPVKAPSHLDDGEVMFTADIAFLVCKGRCLLGNAQRSISLKTTADRYGASSGIEPVIDEAKKQVPAPITSLAGASVQYKGTTLSITAPAGDAKQATFFPIEMPGVTYGEPKAEIREGRVVVSIEVEVRPQNAQGQPLKLAGVIGLGTARSDPCYAFELPLSDM